MSPDEVSGLIRNGLDTLEVDVRSDDDTHFTAFIVSTQFEGLRALQRHQLVYRTLGDRVGREIHALSIRAVTPGELQAMQD